MSAAARAGRVWIATSLIVSLAGCQREAPPDLRTELHQILDEIPTVVADPARAATVRAAYEKLGNVLVESVDERRELAARWNDLYRRYDTPRQELEDVLAENQTSSQRVRMAAIDAREEIRTHTTDSEWRALAKSRKHLAKVYSESRP